MLIMQCFKGIFRKTHVNDLTGMHDLTGNLAYYDFISVKIMQDYIDFHLRLLVAFERCGG